MVYHNEHMPDGLIEVMLFWQLRCLQEVPGTYLEPYGRRDTTHAAEQWLIHMPGDDLKPPDLPGHV